MTVAMIVTAVKRHCDVMSEGLYIKSLVDDCSNECTNCRDSVHMRDTCSAEGTNR